MKRYETMQPKDILEAYEGTKTCKTCLFRGKLRHDCGHDCVSAITEYLTEELVPIPRWKIIKCNDDLYTIYNDYINKTKSPSAYGFVTFLLQKISTDL